MFLKYNNQLGPPFHILIDTNFVNFSIRNKIDVMQGMMDCLYAKCMLPHLSHFICSKSGIPYITDCVLGELEKMGSKFKVALKYVLKSSSHISRSF